MCATPNMPTRSEATRPTVCRPLDTRPRSVFGNFQSEPCERPADDRVTAVPPLALAATSPAAPGDLQSGIDASMARAFLHRFLAKGFEDPTPDGWRWLTSPETLRAFRSSVEALSAVCLGPPWENGRSADPPNPIVPCAIEPESGHARPPQPGPGKACSQLLPLVPAGAAAGGNTRAPVPGAGGALNLGGVAELLAAQLRPEAFEPFQSDYLTIFGHAARGLCPLNEIEYGDLKADPLFQPHRLADLAGFYRAFGLELADHATERHDHICLELEFMSVLAAKEAYALEHQLDPEPLAVVRDAQKKFLREHLGCWVPGFTRRLESSVGRGALAALARFTRVFIVGECARFGVQPGSEDLLLRPVEETDEHLCAACALPAPSGATPAVT